MASITNIYLNSIRPTKEVSSCMETIVIAKPIQLTIVSAVPLEDAGAWPATKEENNGESAMTTKPQNMRKVMKINVD